LEGIDRDEKPHDNTFSPIRRETREHLWYSLAGTQRGENMKYMKGKGAVTSRRRREDDDPMSNVANLFDVAMLFALGFMVMLLTYLSIPEVLTQTDMVIVKNPGQQNMEVIVKSGEQIEKLDMSNATVELEIVGVVGTIYETKDGGMIYSPSTREENP
jgi:hypothetical protein